MFQLPSTAAERHGKEKRWNSKCVNAQTKKVWAKTPTDRWTQPDEASDLSQNGYGGIIGIDKTILKSMVWAY